MLIQEHKILTQEGLDEAVQYCARRGWLATFNLAKKLDSGLASGGVGVLVRNAGDVGVTRLEHDLTEHPHTFLAVRVQVPGMPTHVVASAYFEAVSG